MGLIASQMTKSKTKLETIAVSADSPYVERENVRKLMYAVAVELASHGGTSSPVGSLGYANHASTVWFTADPIGVSMGLPLVTGSASIDWRINLVVGRDPTGGEVITVTTPAYITKDGELANKKTYLGVRERIRSALTSGRLPADGLDAELVAAGCHAWGFTGGPATTPRRQLTIEGSWDLTNVTTRLGQMLFVEDPDPGAYVKRVGLLDESTMTVTVHGQMPCRIEIAVDLAAGRTFAESMVSDQVVRADLGMLARHLRRLDPDATVDGDWTGVNYAS